MMQPAGVLLRQWRERRRLTQLDLALEAEISPRHLSFVETGRAQPSREMLLHLADELNIPLRERNALLIAGGFAPMYQERRLDEPPLAAARHAIDVVLAAQRPFPAFALDRHWNITASNGALPQLFDAVADELLQAPMNALRVSLHPRGLAPRIANLAEWRAHLLSRLRRQIELTGDPALEALMTELAAYPSPRASPACSTGEEMVLVPLHIETSLGLLSFFSTTTIFGTPVDVTLAELAIEMFFPANAATADVVRKAAL